MNFQLFSFSFIVFLISYLISVKNMWFILASININKTKNPIKTVSLISHTLILVGILSFVGGIFNIHPTENILIPCLLIILLVILYINSRLVQK